MAKHDSRKTVLMVMHQAHSTPGRIGCYLTALGARLDIRRPSLDEPLPATLDEHDAVVVFGEPTPLELILATRPDVIVKGGDYGVETVVGANEVMSWGGQVKIVPTVEGYSTTGLLAKGAEK